MLHNMMKERENENDSANEILSNYIQNTNVVVPDNVKEETNDAFLMLQKH